MVLIITIKNAWVGSPKSSGEMSTSETIRFDFELDLEHEIEVDQDGILTVSCFAYSPMDEDPDDAHVECVPFSEMIDGAIEYNCDDLGNEGYGSLYKIGHALREASERVLQAAEVHEDYVNGKGQMPLFEGDGDDV